MPADYIDCELQTANLQLRTVYFSAAICCTLLCRTE